MSDETSESCGRRYNLTWPDYFSDEGYVDTFAEVVGIEPEFTFPSAVAQTWEWMRASGLDQSREFDFSFEDALIAKLRG